MSVHDLSRLDTELASLRRRVRENQDKKFFVVNISELNFRKGPNGPIFRSGPLLKGQKLEFIENNGVWAKVLVKSGNHLGETGWVGLKHIELAPKEDHLVSSNLGVLLEAK